MERMESDGSVSSPRPSAIGVYGGCEEESMIAARMGCCVCDARVTYSRHDTNARRR